MPFNQSDVAALQPGVNSLTQLILGHKNKMAEQQNQANVDVGKAQQMVPIQGQAKGVEQDALNASNMKSLKDLSGMAPDGAQVHAGDLGMGVDPTLRYMQQQRGMSDSAIKDATNTYAKALPKIQDQFNAASEGLQFANDPKNTGSLGQARTLMLKSMGMNRYNEQEAKAVLPPALQGSVSQLFNSVGGDETPLNEAQKRSINTFFSSMADQAHQKHETLKANTLGSYQLRNGYDPTRAEGLKTGVMHNFDQQYDDKMKQFQGMPSTTSPVEDRPAPTGVIDKLSDFFKGGSAKKAQGAQPAAAPARQVVKMMKNKRTGQTKTIYSDGSEETK